MELSPSKRSRCINIHTSTVSCLVDECNADLSQCREYHRRHKVCERHSKAVTVSIGGLHQRFCQQCSRFHTLAEFDEVKRSCRKRLDGHNRRRRKSHIDSGSLISIRKGSTRMLSPEKPIEPLNDFHRHNYVESSSSLRANREGSNHFQYLQSEPTLATTNTDRAFSLLSLPPPLSQRTPTMQPVPCGLDQYDFMKQMDHEAGVCDFDRNNSDTTMQLHGAFHDELGGSSPIGTQQQTPPFEWH